MSEAGPCPAEAHPLAEPAEDSPCQEERLHQECEGGCHPPSERGWNAESQDHWRLCYNQGRGSLSLVLGTPLDPHQCFIHFQGPRAWDCLPPVTHDALPACHPYDWMSQGLSQAEPGQVSCGTHALVSVPGSESKRHGHRKTLNRPDLC